MGDAMTAAFTAIKTDILAGIAAVAPVAITIMGGFMVWKYGSKFFKSLSK